MKDDDNCLSPRIVIRITHNPDYSRAEVAVDARRSVSPSRDGPSTASALKHSRCGKIGPPASPERLAMAGRLALRVRNDDEPTQKWCSQAIVETAFEK